MHPTRSTLRGHARSPLQRLQAGFTLLEIMIATVILGLVLMSVYGVVARSLQAKNRAEERADLYASGREAVLRMADDLEGALPPNTAAGVVFVGLDTTDRVPTDAVLFTVNVRRTNSSSESRGGRAQISYWLEANPDTPSLYVLARKEEMLTEAPSEEELELEEDPEAALEEASQPQSMTAFVMDRVAGLGIHYLDPITGEWVDTWDSTLVPTAGQPPIGLPAAVKITVFLADEKGMPHDFSTAVDLPLMPPPPTPRN